MEEIKITKEQFNKVNRLQYDLCNKYDYISKEIICDKYEITPETTFFTYKDTKNYYLVFNGVKRQSTKIQPSSILDSADKNLKK